MYKVITILTSFKNKLSKQFGKITALV